MPARALLLVVMLVMVACAQEPAVQLGDEPDAGTADEADPAASGLAPDCSDLEVAAQVDGPLSEDPTIAEAQQTRAESGLPSDEATVVRIMTETDGHGPFGFPHTEDEFEEVMGRNPDHDLVDRIRSWAEVDAAHSYGGLWLDQVSGGLLTVAFATDIDRYRDEVRDRYGDDVVVVEVAHPYRELQAIVDQLVEEHPPGAEEVPRLTSWAVYEQHNRVGIGLLGDEGEMRRELSERFGPDRLCIFPQRAPTAEDAQIATWQPDGEVDPTSTQVPVHVMERACAGGEAATGRVVDPEIDYRDDAVVVTFRVIPLGGFQTCPSNPPTPFVLELDEPVGDRQLLDGGTQPPSPPVLDG